MTQNKSLLSWNDFSLYWTSLTLSFISLCRLYGAYLHVCIFSPVDYKFLNAESSLYPGDLAQGLTAVSWAQLMFVGEQINELSIPLEAGESTHTRIFF